MSNVRLGSLIVFVVSLLISQPAYALFVNGGFELGDTTGWTMDGDSSVISSFTPEFNNTTGWISGIPYYGSYSLLLGTPGVGNENPDDDRWGSATQTDTITQADVDSGLHLYFKWGAILEEPTNGVYHSDSDQPYFTIDISGFDGSTWNSLYSEEQRANQTGFTKIGTQGSGEEGDIWYGSDIADINLSSLGLGVGDQVKIDLYVEDCGLGGHGGLVFLDGFGTTEPPDNLVPEPTSLLLLGFGVMGLAGIFRKNI